MNLDGFRNALKEGGCEDVDECSDEKLMLIQIAMSLMTKDEFRRFIDRITSKEINQNMEK